MLALISSAKTMSGVSGTEILTGTTPKFLKEAKEISLNMAQFSVDELAKSLKLNSKLAAENYIRFQNFLSTENHPRQALLSYTGIVYKHINPADFTQSDFEYAQKHLRIASFCYGLLRPLDLIKLYRMEFDVKLPELGDGNMHDYWPNKQTSTFIKDIKNAGGTLVYLAGMEMQPSFDWAKVQKSVRIITPGFKVWKNGNPKTIVIYTKMARGQMVRYLMKNQISDPEELKGFSWEGFVYSEEFSKGNDWVFMQE